MNKKWFYLVFALLLTGCASQAELTARKQKEMTQMIQVYGPACEKLGFNNNTDLWRDCILRLSTQDRIDRYDNRFAWNTCFGTGGFVQCMGY